MESFQSDVTFICPTCQDHAGYPVDIPEPDWGNMEDLSEMHAEGPVLVRCNSCKNEFDAYAIVANHECSITLDGHPDTFINCQPPFYAPSEEWIDYEIPDHPIKIFEDSIVLIHEHLSEQNGENHNQFINRMLFCQAVTALEAFLGDFLQKQLTPNAISNLISKDNELSAEKFTLDQIHKNPNLVEHSLKKHLHSILYHNLPKVSRIYKIAFNVDIWNPSIDKAAILKSINLRHDCVHRNGYTSDGELIETFNNEYIEGILSQYSLLVSHISTVVYSSVAREIFGDDF